MRKDADFVNQKENSIGRWISVLYRYRKSYVNKWLEPYGIVGVQFIILLVLFRRGGASQENISDHLKIDKTTTAKAIKKLENNGYLMRKKDPSDKRAYNVYLTQKALDIIPFIQQTVIKWESIVTSGIPDEEYHMIENVLEKMAENAYSININDLSVEPQKNSD